MKDSANQRYAPGTKRTLATRVLMIAAAAVAVASGASAEGEENTPMRVITEDELASKIGAGGEGEIWLSVLGEVYDVTEGRDYYGEGSGYSVFAGKDASASFSTGDFSAEGAKKDLDDLPVTQLTGVEGWRTFYADHEKYKQIGVLCCEFYGADGKPTEKLTTVQQRLATHAEMKAQAKKEL